MSFKLGVLILISTILIVVFTAEGSFSVFASLDEYIFIFGLSAACFVMSNTAEVQKSALRGMKCIITKGFGKKSDYMSMLLFVFKFFGYMAGNSAAKIESEIENPEGSELFKASKVMLLHRQLRDFCCDYIRILSLGVNDQYTLDDMMNNSIDAIRASNSKASKAVIALSDALPGLGLVAAVFGVVLALSSAGDDAAILAARISDATTS